MHPMQQNSFKCVRESIDKLSASIYIYVASISIL